MIQIRKIRPEESEILFQLSGLVHWNHSSAECRWFAADPASEMIFAEESGVIAGCAGLYCYGQRQLGFINMVIVKPEFRRRGIATAMIRYFLEHYADCATLRLHATPEGSKVYAPLGFRTGRGIGYFTATQPQFGALPPCSGTIVPAATDALEAATAVDAAAFGIARPEVLKANLAMSPELALDLRAPDGTLSGIIRGRRGPRYRQLAALRAPDLAGALQLVKRAAAIDNTTLSLVTYDTQREFQAALPSAGFSRVREMVEMEYGQPGPEPGATGFATFGGDLG